MKSTKEKANREALCLRI